MSMRSTPAARAAVAVLVIAGLSGCSRTTRSGSGDATPGLQAPAPAVDPMLVTAPGGEPVRDAEVEQTKKLHLIVVRRDLTGYQHLHPEPAAGGTWLADVDYMSAGRWHLVADVTPKVAGADPVRVVLGADVEVPGNAPADTPLPAVARVATVDGFDVVLDGQLRFASDQSLTFTVSQDGQLASGLTEYLGAGGHLVAIEQSTLGYTPLRPAGGPSSELAFTARAPRGGRYRLFLQFATSAGVHTAAFTVDVA